MVGNRFPGGEKTTWKMEESDKQRRTSSGKREGTGKN